MRGTFETATRFAVEEIIRNRGHASKFGLILTEDTINGLIDDIVDLLITSRSLKASGDRFMKAMNSAAPPPTPNLPPNARKFSGLKKVHE